MRRLFEEVKRPEPRDRAEGDLQAAGPINPLLGRVARDPGEEVGDERLRVPLIARVPVSLPQRDEILVTVQLPDDLAVAHAAGVEGRNATPVPDGRLTPRNGIEMPIDRLAEAQAAPTQQIELPGGDPLGAPDHPRLSPRSEAPAQQGTRRLSVAEGGEEGR